MSIFPSNKSAKGAFAVKGATPLAAQVTGILVMTFGLLLFLSVVSYSPHDPILFGEGWGSTGLVDDNPARNWIGTIGATMAFAVLWLIGGAAYILPLLVILLGARAMLGDEIRVKARDVAGFLMAIFSLSALMQLRLSSVPTLTNAVVAPGMAGGFGGLWTARFLEQYFASVGSHIILASGLVVSLLLLAPASLSGLRKWLPELWMVGKATAKSLIPPKGDDQAVNGQRTKPVKPNKPVKINRTLSLRGGVGNVKDMSEDENSNPDPRDDKETAVISEEKNDSSGSQPFPEFPITEPVSKNYKRPSPTELLNTPVEQSDHQTDQVLKTQSDVLTQTLQSFAIDGKVTEIHPGPVITMYEFAPVPGIKVARIVNLADDLAMALKALKVRVVAPLSGKSTVGIEVPNPYRETVSLRDILTSDVFLRSRSKLALALGKDIFGRPVVADLRTMPHLLVAGATGAGKSVGLNCVLLNILFAAHPDEVKLLLIDPKVLELQAYDGVPHLLRPVITDPKAASRGLTWVVQEMDRRYRLLGEHGVRSIDAFNRKVGELRDQTLKNERGGSKKQPDLPLDFVEYNSETAGLPHDEKGTQEVAASSQGALPSPLPYIVVVIDEFADLMMVAPKEVEDRIARLAQMARASGIHLILATQRPSVDVVTGLIKANFPARIAYQVSSKIDSRTILDTNGAETLLGKGDMLYLASGTGRVTRLHGPFVSDDDVRNVVEWVKGQAGPGQQIQGVLADEDPIQEDLDRDDIYERAREVVIASGQASASLIQRRLRVGYPRAARMIEQMEEEGLVSPPGRDGKREVLARRMAMEEESV